MLEFFHIYLRMSLVLEIGVILLAKATQCRRNFYCKKTSLSRYFKSPIWKSVDGIACVPVRRKYSTKFSVFHRNYFF